MDIFDAIAKDSAAIDAAYPLKGEPVLTRCSDPECGYSDESHRNPPPPVRCPECGRGILLAAEADL